MFKKNSVLLQSCIDGLSHHCLESIGRADQWCFTLDINMFLSLKLHRPFILHFLQISQTFVFEYSLSMEKEMASHSSILDWRIPWIGSLVGCCTWGQSWTGLKRLSMCACIGEGNGNPLQHSCPENPRDRGAWWAAIYGVGQSQR